MSISELFESFASPGSSSRITSRQLLQQIKALKLKTTNLLKDNELSSGEEISPLIGPNPELGTIIPKSYWPNPTAPKCARDLTSIAAFSVEEPLGQGSFGTVFRIKIRNGGNAALKSIAKPNLDREAAIVKVKTEFNIWRAVSEHPNVVSLFAFFETDANWCFVMEHADGGSLSTYLKLTEGPLEEPQIILLAGQLAHAVFTIHRLGYLHRDISCSNVLLSRGSVASHFNCKLTDFGLSMRGLNSSSRCGSLAYMAPEVLHKNSYGTGADWWSYGIVVYAMGAGKTPLSMYTKKKLIDMDNLSRGGRYEVAKHATIHISRKLPSTRRQFLIDILREDPQERLGVIDKGDLGCFKRHPFFVGFDWSLLDERRYKKVPLEGEINLPALIY